ncbi:flagellar assembly protein FliX [Magnetospirillum sp. UT-4]|uniref:flagellar assembly protein FliX n=1 Tax=Magnetospirillum sp. UT-4 TaxID=2681467 RepID=UPI00138327BA|nr:flagellar assembly protein FliX [Magnetospirillum sp. UT-4]CAA7618598.1 Flagellar assembly regulator FliX, class II [Magnetospirillum sp. UT-4]
MKVSGVGSGSPVGGTRRADKTDGKKGEFKQALVDAMDSMEEVHAAEAPSALGAMDAVLLVQSVGDAPEREARQRMIRHGEHILDRLEDIRHGLLLGTVPESKLVELAQMVRNRRDTCTDPRLAALLDEIELRAEVEIAKLSRGR